MLRYILGRNHSGGDRNDQSPHPSSYSLGSQHGFPSRPSALAFDPVLNLIAVTTKQGCVNVYGRPGVEFYGRIEEGDVSICNIIFIPGQGRLVTLCADNTLHLWQAEFERDGKPVRSSLSLSLSLNIEDKQRKVSSLCLDEQCEGGAVLLLGTETGNVYTVSLANLQFTDSIIYQEVAMQNVPEDYKVNPGAVECVRLHPSHRHKLLIGYNRGLMVVYDRQKNTAIRTYVCNQSLECVCWSRDGGAFMSAHNDGSYIMWNAQDLSNPDGPHTPYGPFPCRSISQLDWFTTNSDGDWIVFSGGMPRASYGDKHTVSVISRDGAGNELKHVAFEFTSSVVSFLLMYDPTAGVSCKPHSLLVLAEEELVCIDLSSDGWPLHQLPYLNSVHSSAVTCSCYVSSCTAPLLQKLQKGGRMGEATGEVCRRKKSRYSNKPWPVTGGSVLSDTGANCDSSSDLIITGHEDGSVRIWLANTTAFHQLCKVSTGRLFSGADFDGSQVADEADPASGREEEEDEDEMFPPLRSVGQFDPYSDDPRLAVKRVAFCPASGDLLVGGTAGQVTLWSMTDTHSDPPQAIEVNLVAERDGFVWKGHDRLTLRDDLKSVCKYPLPGYVPCSVLQLLPPATVSAASLQASWGVFAVGTGHGFVLYDYLQNKLIMHKCTLHPHDYAASGEPAMSRNKSLKKSLRESFRRLRRGRSQRQMAGLASRKTTGSVQMPSARNRLIGRGTTGAPVDLAPVERAVEARSEDPAYASMVRCLCLAACHVANNRPITRTLWAGTNSGCMFIFIIHCPVRSDSRRSSQPVLWEPGKEFRLKHGAPVLDIQILDSTGAPLIQSTQSDTSGSQPSPHRVLISSEEQFKVFTLPSMKPFGKFKLTALEGSRVRKLGFARFSGPSDSAVTSTDSAASGQKTGQWCVVFVTNQGELQVLGLPDLHRHLQHTNFSPEDIQGISSTMFGHSGDVVFAVSSSLYQRVSLSSALPASPLCSLQLVKVCPAEKGEDADVDSTAKPSSPKLNDGGANTETPGGGDETEVVEISSEEARKLMDGMKALANGGTQHTHSVEKFSEQVGGVTKSMEKSKHSEMSAKENPDTNALVAEQQETELLSTGEAGEEGGSRRRIKVVRTTRITAEPTTSQL